MSKILVIGQAPPAVKQEYPYDSTMLYDWLAEVNISKDKAQDLFEFEAIYDKFPGFGENGHLKPTQKQMDSHWKVLETKIQVTKKVWLLGNVSRDYFYSKPKTWSCNLEIIETIHPSKRNWSLYQKNKKEIINKIRSIL